MLAKDLSDDSDAVILLLLKVVSQISTFQIEKDVHELFSAVHYRFTELI